MTQPQDTVIVGSGFAGITLARELRKLDPARPIRLISADDGAFYSKPSLSNALVAGKEAANLALSSAEKLAKDLRLDFMTHVRAETIDADNHRLHTSLGELSYAHLVLAVGAEPLRLPLQGDGAGDVVSVNSLVDYAEFRRRLKPQALVAIIGAGLIGCEFANDLCASGHGAHLFDLADQMLPQLLPTFAAHELQTKLAAAGVVFHPRSRLKSVVKTGECYRLQGEGVDAGPYDLVLSAAGLRPRLALAQSGGIAVATGIVTDRWLRTSAADVYALGDCVEMAGQVLPYIQPILLGAKSLAQTLTGTPTPVNYPAMPVVVKTPACPVALCPPPADRAGNWEQTAVDGGLRALYRDAVSAEPCGFILMGEAAKERTALAARMPPLLAPMVA